MHGANLSEDPAKHAEGDLPVMIWEQDEVIYKSNCHQKAAWMLKDMSRIYPKSDGAGIMISGFRSVTTGWLKLNATEYDNVELALGRKPTHFYKNDSADSGSAADDLHYSFHFFSYGINRSGYWNAEKMSLQMEEIAAAVGVKFPNYKHVFLFDWSCCHDALQSGGFRCDKFKMSAGFQHTRDLKTVSTYTTQTANKACYGRG